MAAKTAVNAKNGGRDRLLAERGGPRRSDLRAAPTSAELYQALLEGLSQMLCRVDLDGHVLEVNAAFAGWVGVGADELIGKTDLDLFPAELAALLSDHDRRACSGAPLAAGETYDVPGRTPGRVRLVRVPVRDGRGQVIGLHRIWSEAGDDARRSLEEQSSFLQILLEQMPDSIYFKDRASRFLAVSRHLALKLGIDDPREAVGKTDFDFFLSEHAAQAFRDEQEIMRTGVPLVNVEEKETLPGGVVTWVSTTKMPLRDAAGRVIGTFGISRDITDRKRMEERLAEQAFYDGTTALPNRALFLNRLDHLFRRTQRQQDLSYLFAVLHVDLDRFKQVNDSLGHHAGDALLVQTARRLESCLRPSDTLARVGSDEFIVLLEDLRSSAEATRIAERIQADLATPFEVAGTEVFATASIGIALSSSGYARPEEMLRDADTALHRAKANGRARHEVFDAEMHRRAVSQLRLETDLRRAIERRELVVHYQPIVDLESKQMTGFEALVRWKHPQRGLVSPAVFIGLAEETGLIAPISLWVLEESCRQLADWHRRFPRDPQLRVAVNLSSQQITSADLVKEISAILARTGLDAGTLTLEITESALMRDVTVGAEVIQQLRDLSIQLNIDDFGTGYSSLAYLDTLPLDALKIDRSFVAAMTAQGGRSEIVQAIVAMAHSLGMKVIAEGVETREQLERLRALKCQGAQGYFFARPLPAEEIEALIINGLKF